MNKQWQEWTRRFAKLSQRERILVFAAVVIGLVMGAEVLFIDPLWAQRSRLDKDMQALQSEHDTLEQVVGVFTSSGAEPGAADLAQLNLLETQLAELTARLDQVRSGLVSPQAMPALLESLLARHHRLKLVSLQTLPTEPVATEVAEVPPAATEPANNPKESQRLYRHPMELRLSGSYADITAYVAALERLRPRLLWSGLELDASRHPSIELKLRLYTLSLEKAWLAL